MSYNNYPKADWKNLITPIREAVNNCKNRKDLIDMYNQAADFCVRMQWPVIEQLTQKQKDEMTDEEKEIKRIKEIEKWFDKRYWDLIITETREIKKNKPTIVRKPSHIRSKKGKEPFLILKNIFGDREKPKDWSADCRNFIYFCHLYVMYKCMDKQNLNKLYKNGFLLGLPIDGREFGCNWITVNLFFEREKGPIKSIGGFGTRHYYHYKHSRLYLRGEYGDKQNELIERYQLQLIRDEKDEFYILEKDLLDTMNIGSRISFTCIPMPINTEFKNENVIYLGNENFSAVPYCTDTKPTMGLDKIKKEYSEHCREKLLDIYKEYPEMAKSPYVNKKNRFKKRQVIISSIEIIETITE